MTTTATQRIEHRDVGRAGFTETFVTARVTAPIAKPEDAKVAFDDVAQALAERGVHVLQEKVYGLTAHHDALLAVRREAYAGRGLEPSPATFIEGAPCVGGCLAGVQIIGVLPRDGGATVRTVARGEEPVGRLLETRDYRVLFLSGVSDPRSAKGVCVTDQGARMFEQAGVLLAQEGFRPQDIVRTWIYIPRLLDWYGEFNRVRT
ncbi:MAG: hypothetical protein ACYTG6_02035, partial [Planctomycetota bacterium]